MRKSARIAVLLVLLAAAPAFSQSAGWCDDVVDLYIDAIGLYMSNCNPSQPGCETIIGIINETRGWLDMYCGYSY